MFLQYDIKWGIENISFITSKALLLTLAGMEKGALIKLQNMLSILFNYLEYLHEIQILAAK